MQRLNHHPQLVFPPGVQQPIDTIKFAPVGTGTPPITQQDIERLKRIYSPTCIAGEKYGALCQDGVTVTDSLPVDAGVCSAHGGVISWIECK